MRGSSARARRFRSDRGQASDHGLNHRGRAETMSVSELPPIVIGEPHAPIHEGLEVARVSQAFANDVLLALSCRESGCILVTESDRDVSRIRRILSFEYMKPWPALDLGLVGARLS